MNTKKTKEYAVRVTATLTNGEKTISFIAIDHHGKTRMVDSMEKATMFKYVSAARKRIKDNYAIMLQEPSIATFDQELIDVSQV